MDNTKINIKNINGENEEVMKLVIKEGEEE